MKKYSIYTLEHNGVIFYVGKSINIKNRLRKHKSESRLKRTYKENFINKVLLDGGKITISILDEVEMGTENQNEIYWISQLKQWGFKLCNSSFGGEGGDTWSGKKHKIETRNKLRDIMIENRKNGKVYKPSPGENNGRSKLLESQVIELRKMRIDNNTSYGKLSLMYGVAKSTVIDIVKRRLWTHI